MTWKITRAKPVAGVRTVAPGLVELRMDEAFDQAPRLDAVAAHLHLHPRELLHSICATAPTKQLEGVRLLARLALLRETMGRDPLSLSDLLYMAHRSPDQLAVSLRRSASPSKSSAAREDFWDWTVPLRGPSLETAGEVPVLLIVRLSDSLQHMVDLRRRHMQSTLDLFELYGDDFVQLREACARVRSSARLAHRLAVVCQGQVDEIIPELQKMISLCHTMLQTWGIDHDRKATPANETRLAELITRLELMVELVGTFLLRESKAAGRRERAMGDLRRALAAVDEAAATRMISFGALAPSATWFEYHDAMVETARAVAAGPIAIGAEIFEQHFVPMLATVVDTAPIGQLDAAGLVGEVEQALGHRIRAFSSRVLGLPPADELRPAFSDFPPPAGISEFAEASVKPIERFLSMCETANILGPMLGLRAASQDEHADVPALIGRLALGLFGGLSTAPSEQAWTRLVVKALASPIDRAEFVQATRDVFKEVREAAAKSEHPSASNSATQAQCAAELLVLFGQGVAVATKRGALQASDYLELTRIAAEAGDKLSAAVIDRYATTLATFGDRQVVANLTGSEAALWLRGVSKAGFFAVVQGVSMARAYTLAEEKRQRADMTGGRDVTEATLGLATAALDLAVPGVGTLLSATFEISAVLADLARGSPSDRARGYLNGSWNRLSPRIFELLELETIPLESLDVAWAFDPSKKLRQRVRALHWLIATGSRSTEATEADHRTYLLDLACQEGGYVWYERLPRLERFGFRTAEARWLLRG